MFTSSGRTDVVNDPKSKRKDKKKGARALLHLPMTTILVRMARFVFSILSPLSHVNHMFMSSGRNDVMIKTELKPSGGIRRKALDSLRLPMMMTTILLQLFPTTIVDEDFSGFAALADNGNDLGGGRACNQSSPIVMTFVWAFRIMGMMILSPH
jgi:hypothetical protein